MRAHVVSAALLLLLVTGIILFGAVNVARWLLWR